ncbi:hypothetical protein SAMN05216344_10818 [Polaromonas sp. OV174]|uniref:hypothetical protein n=1 Tax=Polaromonas sp. OV174 TaxID=1855300 RepID=UPI0008E9FD7A|nr:hypothetical protein [Polaromonas sp. OV174]SFC05465.1 hypothetical protein SAMN05216344_10818 [Polaromonas sp. OV174]
MTTVEAFIYQLAAFPGVEGCALVDADTGMAWHHAGSMPDMEQIGEASIEFWRVHKRLSSHFRDFGNFNSSAHSFANRVIALFPCSREPALVLVCVATKGNIDWVRWGEKLAGLKHALALPRDQHLAGG